MIRDRSVSAGVDINADGLAEIIKFLMLKVKEQCRNPTAKAELRIRSSFGEFSSLESFLSNANHRYQATPIRNLVIDARFHDFSPQNMSLNSYRTLEVRFNDKGYTIQSYGCVFVPLRWIDGAINDTHEFMKIFHINTRRRMLMKFSALGTAATTFAGGLVLAATVHPVLALVSGAAVGASVLGLGKIPNSTSRFSFLPAPQRNADVVVDAIR